jgi:hypothetical protein
MKKIFLTIVAVFMVVFIASASIYVYSSGTNKTVGAWTYWTASMTFTAATDTIYEFLPVSAPNAAYPLDTLIAIINTTTIPASSVVADTVNVQLELWVASDTSGWRKGSVTFNNGMFKKYTIGRDSTASGWNQRNTQYTVGQHGGRQPIAALVGIGKAALSNGKGNEAGVIVRTAYLEQ